MPKKQYDEKQPIYRSRRERHQKKKKNSWLPIVLLLGAFALAAVAGALFASSSLFDDKPTENKAARMASPDKTVVMLMGVNERNLPSKATEGYPFSGMDKVAQKEYLSSKRSLLYVAITRARQLVYMVGFGEPSGLLDVVK